MASSFGAAAPIFRVADLASSLAYYTEGLGFTRNWGDSGLISVSRGALLPDREKDRAVPHQRKQLEHAGGITAAAALTLRRRLYLDGVRSSVFGPGRARAGGGDRRARGAACLADTSFGLGALLAAAHHHRHRGGGWRTRAQRVTRYADWAAEPLGALTLAADGVLLLLHAALSVAGFALAGRDVWRAPAAPR